MESVQTDFKKALDGHQCHFTPPFTSLEVVRRNANGSCLTCRLWLACIDWAVPELAEYDDIRSIATFEMHSPTPGLHMIKLFAASTITLATFQLDADPLHAMSSLPTSRLLPGSTSSEATFTSIRNWLHQCETEHPDCAQLTANKRSISTVGIRLLEIRQNGLLLVNDVSDLSSYNYACLSHCWGSGKEISRTLVANLQAHLTIGIGTEALPLSFKDAVETCRRLNIGYIWIDSLCIIQDSVEDWRVQAALMADIYENARITIAASSANAPTKGCFRETHCSYVGQPLPGFAETYIRRVPDGPSAAYEASDWPLFKRGWVFQELSLSPRVIHFGNQEVMWQCQTKQHREDQQDKVWASEPRTMIFPKLSDHDVTVLPQQWYDVVQAYSWRALTFSKDRLPAIAAMATRFKFYKPLDRYLAGLWQSSLCFDLLWYNLEEDDTVERNLEVVVTERITNHSRSDKNMPSWSWASTNLGVWWDSAKRWDSAGQTALGCVEVLNIAYTIEGPDVSGEIQTAAVTLRAPVFKLDSIRGIEDMNSSNGQCHQWTDTGMPEKSLSTTGNQLIYENFYWDDYGQAERGEKSHVLHELYLVFLYSSGRQKALVIKETQRPNHFIRLGVVVLELIDAWADGMKRWKEKQARISPERLKEYSETLRSMLEAAETRVITLV